MGFFKSAEEYYKEMTSTLKDVDTSEHSLIYNANMPVSMELSYQTMLLDEIEKRIHAKDALNNGYYDSLIKFCNDMGIERSLATKATGLISVTGNAGSKLPKNSYVAKNTNILYVTLDDLTLNNNGIGEIGIIACETGSKYNCDANEIKYFPVKYEGILQVTNKTAITNGYDDETYELLYNRYLNKVTKPSTGGNKYDYENWALEVDNVGYAKCITAIEENNAGVVKVIIANSNKRSADEALIKKTYDYIEEVRPVLAGTLKVETVTEVNIDIDIEVEIETSVTLNDIKTKYIQAVEEYFDDKVYTTKKISVAKLQSILIDIDGVIDCAEIKINNSTSNITLNFDEVAVLKNVQLGVM